LAKRRVNDVTGALEYATDDISVTKIDGQCSGKVCFREYLSKNKYEGSWQAPVATGADTVIVKGQVKRFMLPINLVATYKVKNGKISEFKVSRA